MKKRLISLLVGGALAVGATVGMSACGSGKRDFTVWVPNTQQQLTKELIEEFKKANPDVDFEIKVGVCGEGEAYANVSKDVQASADVYGFANDQIINLKKCGGIARLSDAAVAKIKEENVASAVDACVIKEGGEDHYYAYPYAADNGYFMYYDSTVISKESIGTMNLTEIMDACRSAGKYVLFNLSKGGSSWYAGSFFYGAGGDYTVERDGTVTLDSGCNFDSKPEGENYTYGQIAGDAMVKMRAHKAFVNADDTVISQYASNKRIGAVITGTWNAPIIQESMGEGYAATKLPEFHSDLTNKDYQMISFIGSKLYGVNPNSVNLDVAHRLAAFLSSEAAQQKRFELGIGPSNIKVQQSEPVKNNTALAGFAVQSQYAKAQIPLPDEYWAAFDAFGADVYAGIKDGELDKKLESLIKSLNNEQ